MFLGWIFVFAGLMGALFFLITPGTSETVIGFSVASLACGLFMIYLGYTKKTFFKK
jgi:multisubunit Na+/H+ antiporter MnhC subunit